MIEQKKSGLEPSLPVQQRLDPCHIRRFSPHPARLASPKLSASPESWGKSHDDLTIFFSASEDMLKACGVGFDLFDVPESHSHRVACRSHAVLSQS